MKVNIYCLKDPRTKEVRYIGRTKRTLSERLAGHKCKAKVKITHKDCWIYSLLNIGLEPIIELLTIVEGWNESYRYEQNLIREYLKDGYDLTNTDDRGEGGINKIITQNQKDKISNTLKLRYKQGLVCPTKKALDVYDLEGNFIQTFDSMRKCALWLNIGDKQIQCCIKRKAKRTKNYQIRLSGTEKPGKYINKRDNIFNNKEVYLLNIETNECIRFKKQTECMKFLYVKGSSYIKHFLNTNKIVKGKYKILSNMPVKQGELLETPITVCEDNQQPSLSSNTFEGSTTNSQIQTTSVEDSNANTSALPIRNNSDDIV